MQAPSCIRDGKDGQGCGHSMSEPPRDVPRMVPPCSWMLSTLRWVRTTGLLCLS